MQNSNSSPKGSSDEGSLQNSLDHRIRYSFKNVQLKELALTRKSFAGENDQKNHNERLEFLGDAVFELCVSDLLMTEYPDADEGDLSKMRASVVNTNYMAQLALDLKLDRDMKVGLSERRDPDSLPNPRPLASVLEAVIGAVYLDGGWKTVRKVVKNLIVEKIKNGLINKDYKSILQEFTQKKFQTIPSYSLIKIFGPSHEKTFIMRVKLGEKNLGEGEGRTKKQATQSAALSALKHFEVPPYISIKN